MDPLPGNTASAFLESDLPCRRCSYNLRGLPPDGRCPECGMPIALSQRGERLVCSSPLWLAGLCWGVRLNYLAVLLPIPALIAIASMDSRSGSIVAAWVLLVARAALFTGWFLLSRADPSGAGEQRNQVSRYILRIGACVGLAEVAITFLAVFLYIDAIVPMAWTSTCFALAIGIAAELRRLEVLIERIPDIDVSQQFRSLLIFYAACWGLVLVMLLFAAIVFVYSSSMGIPEMMCALVIPAGGFFIFALVYFVLLLQSASLFKQHAGIARAYWDVHEPA